MCAAGVTVLSCHLGPSRPYMQTRLPFLFFLPTSNMELSAVPERPVLAPENTGCDTACMRLAVGLAGGRDSLGMLQEMLQETEAAAAGMLGQDMHGLLTFHTGISLLCRASLCKPCNRSTCKMPVHSSVALGLSRNRLGAGSPHYQLVDSEVPGSKI